MGQALKYIINTWLAIFICSNLFGQEDTAEVQSIRVYVAYIDSINNLGYAQNVGFLHSVADGVIKRDGDIVGGFGVYGLENLKEDTIYRIEYNGGVNVTVNKAYYYRSNQIVFARLKLLDKNGEFYRREEFYNNGNILRTDLKEIKKASNYPNETALPLMEDGVRYLEDFKKEHSRR